MHCRCACVLASISAVVTDCKQEWGALGCTCKGGLKGVAAGAWHGPAAMLAACQRRSGAGGGFTGRHQGGYAGMKGEGVIGWLKRVGWLLLLVIHGTAAAGVCGSRGRVWKIQIKVLVPPGEAGGCAGTPALPRQREVLEERRRMPSRHTVCVRPAPFLNSTVVTSQYPWPPHPPKLV